MKVAFWLGIVLGFGGLLAAAHFVPWVAHPRVPSQTKVVANGGRAEQFLIRLPVDRIGTARGENGGLRTVAAKVLPAELEKQPVLVEHFKVRDSAGNVIGLAARHWSGAADAGTAWSVLIPSRGALLLTARGEVRGALDTALKSAGYSAGAAWTGDLKVELTPHGGPSGATGTVAAGSEEFGDLEGGYSEVWTVTGVTASGELRGTIELNTVTHRT